MYYAVVEPGTTQLPNGPVLVYPVYRIPVVSYFPVKGLPLRSWFFYPIHVLDQHLRPATWDGRTYILPAWNRPLPDQETGSN
jgi:hypothetical protein